MFLPVALVANPVRQFWFNGAEINRYDLQQARYGEIHPGHAELIFVTEPFRTDIQVKDESGADDAVSTDVLKLNALRTFNTGIYSYRTMTSTFRPVDLDRFPHALKSTTTIQDWCGQTFQQINRTPTGWRSELFSYFERFGDQAQSHPDAWLEDEVWLLLRLDPSRLPQGPFSVIPGALHNRFNHQPIAVTTAVGNLNSGGDESTYTMVFPDLKRTLEISFDTAFPHIIRAWVETGPGGTTTAVLRDRIMNSTYWSENRPSDRRLRKGLGLEPIPD